MIRHRIYYCALILLLGLVAFVMKDKYTIALFFTFLFLPFLSFLFTFISSLSISAEQNLNKTYTTKGAPVTLKVIIKNRGVLLCPNVAMRWASLEDINYEFSEKTTFAISPRSVTNQEARIICKYRGSYKVGCSKLLFMDYLKLFRFTKTLNHLPEIFVYPQVKEIRLPADVIVQDQDSITIQPMEIDNSDVFDYREYTDNDDIRRIHWKLSSKSEELIVKKYASMNKTSAVIVLDFTAAGDEVNKKELEDSMAETAISLIKFYLSRGQAVDFIFNNSQEESLHINSMQDFHKAHYLCASMEFNSTFPFDKLIENYISLNKENYVLFLLTATVNMNLYEQVKRATLAGYKAQVISFEHVEPEQAKPRQIESEQIDRGNSDRESMEDLFKSLPSGYFSPRDILR